jgi:D-arabinitol dehydrogenase (NADP+)
LMKIQACGLCGTNLHIHEGEFAPRFPLIPGHEFTGTVAATGSAVTGLPVGQTVVANSNKACGHCFYCVRGDSRTSTPADILMLVKNYVK